MASEPSGLPRAGEGEDHMARAVLAALVTTALFALIGCSSLKQPETYIRQQTVCIERWFGYHKPGECQPTAKLAASDIQKEKGSGPAALDRDRRRLADELEAKRKQNEALNGRVGDLERQLADRDKEFAALRGDLSAETAKLKGAQRGLVRALRPEIDKGRIAVDLNSERLLINLASRYLFDSGEDQLKPEGADALQRVGGVLKDFPEKQVHVAGYTDNVPIKGALQKKYPSNKELSEARANGAAQALRDGGVANLTAAGHGETAPVASNTTGVGRAKNRRVEVIVK
jgi:chemotaxis protein MotB